MSEQDLVVASQTSLREQFAALGLSARQVALIGVPLGQNCSAYANYLGTLQLLRDAGAEVAYATSWMSLDMAAVAALGRDALTVVCAAASGSQPRVASLMRSVPNPAIILPDTAPLSDAAAADLAAVLGLGGNITVFAASATARDAILQTAGGNGSVSLLPPPGFMLGSQLRAPEPEYDVVWVARTERKDGGAEAAARLMSQPAEKVDLPEFPDGLHIDVVVKRRPPTVLLTDWSSLVFRSQEARLNCNALVPERRAWAFLRRGLHILSLGRTVITDRPGAQLLCLLLGIPHVLTGDPAGTNRSFFQTWAPKAGFAHFADNAGQGWVSARNLVHDMQGN